MLACAPADLRAMAVLHQCSPNRPAGSLKTLHVVALSNNLILLLVQVARAALPSGRHLAWDPVPCHRAACSCSMVLPRRARQVRSQPVCEHCCFIMLAGHHATVG